MLNRRWTIKPGRESRAWAFLLTLLLLSVMFTGRAEAAKYASVVINGYTGDVLFSRSADARRHPASLTKIMTLYMLFEALDKGQVTLDTRMRISRRAAGQAPSKLGLRPGSTILVEHAIKALIVRSANDVAVVVAEHLGKTEFRFARMMTKKARTLGMNATQFRNASGLPNSKQYTTARDMARLCFRLISDHPRYYRYFATQSIRWGGKTYKTHNRVLKNFLGTDGIKTGYTRASGFNLATSTKRNGYHLIGIVFGGKTNKSRDAHMRKILNEQFARIDRNPHLGRRYAVIPLPVAKPATGKDSIRRAEPLTAGVQAAIPLPVAKPAIGKDAITRAEPLMAESQTVTADVPPDSPDPIGDLIAAEEKGILGVLPANNLRSSAVTFPDKPFSSPHPPPIAP